GRVSSSCTRTVRAGTGSGSRPATGRSSRWVRRTSPKPPRWVVLTRSDAMPPMRSWLTGPSRSSRRRTGGPAEQVGVSGGRRVHRGLRAWLALSLTMTRSAASHGRARVAAEACTTMVVIVVVDRGTGGYDGGGGVTADG